MITLAILLIMALAVIFTIITLLGGAIVVFIDPIIAVLIITLLIKLIKKITNKVRK